MNTPDTPAGTTANPPSPSVPAKPHLAKLLGPAFVAAVAYVDPGNVAANITAGARYGYLLLWVLVAANVFAVVIQYLSAKLGIVTGKSLPQLLGDRLTRPKRIAFWLQAEVVAAATDLAEIIGGAIALHLLFGLDLFVGGIVIGIVSLGMLNFQSRKGQQRFEHLVIALLLVITLGFLAGLVINPPDWGQAAEGLFPRFADTPSVLVAASMLGATVMPHAIYLHSSLVNDRHGEAAGAGHLTKDQLLRATRFDVTGALALAGMVNIGLLLLAAASLHGVEGTDTIQGAHAAITQALGPAIGVIFAIGLLASGLASTSVGAYAGSEIMRGLLHVKISLLARRLITLIPALVILALGVDPTWALVISQVVLSFGIPFAVIPLIALTRNPDVMGAYRNTTLLRWTAGAIATLIVALNLLLLVLTLTGQS